MNSNSGSPGALSVGHGVVMIATGAGIVLLRWVLPAVAPVAIAVYGVYLIGKHKFMEGFATIGGALLLWIFRGVLGGLLWWVGALMLGGGIFLLLRGLRGAN